MSELVWEWALPTNETVTARVDDATYVESIYVGQRLVSRSGNGGKPLGHTITLPASTSGAGGYRVATPHDLVVKFDGALSSFELRANGQLVAPTRSPNAPPPETPPGRVYGFVGRPAFTPATLPPGSGTGKIVKIGLGVVVALVVFVGTAMYVRRFASGVSGFLAGSRGAAPAGALTASNGLATVHYPAGFAVKEQSKSESGPKGSDDACRERTCTIQMSIVELTSTSRDEGAFVASFKMNGKRVGRDPWLVSNYLHEHFSEVAKVHGAAYVETARKDETCLGEAGAVVIGHFTDNKNQDGTVWTCTFIRDGNAYWVGTFVNAKYPGDEPALRAIVDATEIAPAR